MGNLVEQLTDERVILLQAIKVFPLERTSEASNSIEIITWDEVRPMIERKQHKSINNNSKRPVDAPAENGK